VLARLHRTALEHLGVAAMPVVDGRRGLQVWVPVGGRHPVDEVEAWVDSVTRAVEATVSDVARGPVRGLFAPFGARATAGAPVAVPITWDELDDPQLAPDRWTIRTLPERLAAAGDPLHPLIGLAQDLPAV
jgi:bifunctional non-homologous end joining protein LigD